MQVRKGNFTTLQPSQQDQLIQNPTDLKTTQQGYQYAVLGYLLYALGIVFGITALIGVIVNHTSIKKTKHTIGYSHCRWQIVSFWVLFAGVVATVIMWPGAHGQSLIVACLIWWLLSLLTGSWFLVQKKPVPWIAGADD